MLTSGVSSRREELKSSGWEEFHRTGGGIELCLNRIDEVGIIPGRASVWAEVDHEGVCAQEIVSRSFCPGKEKR